MGHATTFAILALIVATTTAQPWLFGSNGVGANVWRAAKETAAVIKKPINQTFTFLLNSHCAALKELFGLAYGRLPEPDLDQLTLNFQSRDIETSFKLGNLVESLPNTIGVDPRRPLVIIIHGFTDDLQFFAFPIVNEAFQSIGYYNVLGLDASSLIRSLYLRSSTYARHIGEKLGDTLAAMVNAGLDPEDIYLVGHSLGSQIAGYAGKSFQRLTGRRIGRITGLDPAGPCFSLTDDNLRLKASDADFVDVIHTNGGVLGMKEPVGHVDFYPNGGELQPNCLFELCAHRRVVELFAESVRKPEAFPARRCASWNDFEMGQCSDDVSLMGYGCKKSSVRGRYYLRTGGTPPFELGVSGMKKGRVIPFARNAGLF